MFQKARWSIFSAHQCRECEQHFVDGKNCISIFDWDMCLNCADASDVVQVMKEEKSQEDCYMHRF